MAPVPAVAHSTLRVIEDAGHGDSDAFTGAIVDALTRFATT